MANDRKVQIWTCFKEEEKKAGLFNLLGVILPDFQSRLLYFGQKEAKLSLDLISVSEVEVIQFCPVLLKEMNEEKQDCKHLQIALVNTSGVNVTLAYLIQ